MAALFVLVALLLASSVWLAFTLGRVSSDRRPNLNHHQMMALLMELRHKDDVVPFMDSRQRVRLNRLLDEYERLDLDDE